MCKCVHRPLGLSPSLSLPILMQSLATFFFSHILGYRIFSPLTLLSVCTKAIDAPAVAQAAERREERRREGRSARASFAKRCFEEETCVAPSSPSLLLLLLSVGTFLQCFTTVGRWLVLCNAVLHAMHERREYTGSIGAHAVLDHVSISFRQIVRRTYTLM